VSFPICQTVEYPDSLVKRVDRFDGAGQFCSGKLRWNEKLKNLLREHRGKQFMVFHPSWGYFAREYGLTQVPIEIEGKSPKPAQLSELIKHALEQKITVIFAQKQFSTKNAEVIARAIGGKVVLVDPLALDWFANMEHTGAKFKKAAQ